MNILTQDKRNRIRLIANMEATSSEIEYAISMLCLDVASDVLADSFKSVYEALSFDSMSSKLFPAKTIDTCTEFGEVSEDQIEDKGSEIL